MSLHAEDRVNERYGPTTQAELKKMRAKVVQGCSTFVRRAQSDRSERTLLWKGTLYRFVWNHRAADFVTFLPPEES